MTSLSHKQHVLLLIAENGACTIGDLETELQIPRSTVVDKTTWLVADRAVERKKVGRYWHFKPTLLGYRLTKSLDAIRKLEAGE